jgi:hypothetical protein
MTFAMWSQAVLLGASFGLLHAFDADHLATIGGLAVRDASRAPTSYALRWALGHGAAIGIIALLVLGFELTRAQDVSRYFELVVSLALLAIGAQAIVAALRSARTPLVVRQHAATANRHVHFLAPWHVHPRRGGGTSVLMGLVHGGAGSAAVLALLPLSRFDSRIASALYLLCFCAGVAVGALAFARVFAAVAHRTTTAGARLAAGFQAGVGVAAIASGALLLYETAHGGG